MTEDGAQHGEGDPVPGDRWDELDRLLDEALDRPQGEREAYLREACGEDAELLARALRLVEAAEAEEGFLDRGDLQADTGLARALADRLDLPVPEDVAVGDLEPGTQLGVYRIEEVLGRGGLGTVYRAARADGAFQRDVAVKVMRGVGQRDEMEGRFHAEREILAALRHPNIAAILDGGTLPDGRPYLVMERVEGWSIREYCRRRALGLEERVRLLLQACRAVQYAHRNLVVHRDLKPSNILVDRDGTVKLVDFGIAKLLDDDLLTQEAPRTRTQFRLLTPEYAAPEQIRGDPITTATDVYQLGLLLQEVLTERKPKAAEADSPGQLERVVCREGEDGPGAMAPSRRLRRAIQGDLDTIALKALRTEPERRYASAGELADDLERYLSGQPVGARPDRLDYRARRFVRRHPVRAAVAASAAVLLLAQGVMATVYAERLATERDIATAEAAKAEEVRDFLVDLFRAAGPDGTTGEPPDVRDLLATGRDRLDDLESEPEVYAEVLDVVGSVHQAWGDWPTVRPVFEEAVDFLRETHRGDHPDLADALNSMGHVERAEGNYDAAEDLYRSAKEMRVRLHGPDHPDVACSLNNLGLVARNRGDAERAADLYEEALELRLAEVDRNSRCIGNILNNLGRALRDLGELEAARERHLESIEVRRSALGDYDPDLASGYHALSQTLRRMHRWGEATEAMERAVEIGRETPMLSDRQLATHVNNLGFLLQILGEHERAVEAYRESVEYRKQVWGEDSRRTALGMNNLGGALRMVGRFEESREAHEAALAIRAAQGLPVGEASVHNNLARLEIAVGNLAAARARLERAGEILEGQEDVWERWPAETRGLRGWVLVEEGSLEEAEPLLLEAHGTLVDEHGLAETSTRETARVLADLYERMDRPAEAERYRALARLPEPRQVLAEEG